MPALGRCKSDCDTSETLVLASMPCYQCPEVPPEEPAVEEVVEDPEA
jgi:hypothetical protein